MAEPGAHCTPDSDLLRSQEGKLESDRGAGGLRSEGKEITWSHLHAGALTLKAKGSHSRMPDAHGAIRC